MRDSRKAPVVPDLIQCRDISSASKWGKPEVGFGSFPPFDYVQYRFPTSQTAMTVKLATLMKMMVRPSAIGIKGMMEFVEI